MECTRVGALPNWACSPCRVDAVFILLGCGQGHMLPRSSWGFPCSLCGDEVLLVGRGSPVALETEKGETSVCQPKGRYILGRQ